MAQTSERSSRPGAGLEIGIDVYFGVTTSREGWDLNINANPILPVIPGFTISLDPKTHALTSGSINIGIKAGLPFGGSSLTLTRAWMVSARAAYWSHVARQYRGRP
jgi:hypothetical protein